MTVQETGKYALNVALGTGDFVVEKARSFAGNLRNFDARDFWINYQKQLVKAYDGLAVRGDKLRKSVKRSKPAQRASEQTKLARRQVKAAATSVRKAVTADFAAAGTAAKKVG